LRMGYLPLKVGDIDMIMVDQANVPNTCTGQVESRRAAQSASADDERMRLRDSLLAFDAPFVQKNVT